MSRTPRIGLVVLAAGGSMRLGAPKQALAFKGRSLLRRAAETAVESGCRPVVVVLGAEAELLARELRGLPVAMTLNHDWRRGIGTSIGCGIKVLEPGDLDGAVMMLCDQPLVTAADIRALVTAFEDGKGSIIASRYNGIDGVPALFGREHFPGLAALNGEEGARKLIARHRDDVFAVPNDSAALDIDTTADFAKLREIPRRGMTTERDTP